MRLTTYVLRKKEKAFLEKDIVPLLSQNKIINEEFIEDLFSIVKGKNKYLKRLNDIIIEVKKVLPDELGTGVLSIFESNFTKNYELLKEFLTFPMFEPAFDTKAEPSTEKRMVWLIEQLNKIFDEMKKQSQQNQKLEEEALKEEGYEEGESEEENDENKQLMKLAMFLRDMKSVMDFADTYKKVPLHAFDPTKFPDDGSSLKQYEDALMYWAKQLTNDNGFIFRLSLKLTNQLTNGQKIEYKTSKKPSENIQMNQGKDIENIIPSEYAQDDDVFDNKLVKGQLNQKEYLKKTNRQLLYILEDISGSMHGLNTLYTNAIILALVNSVIAKGDILYCKFFDDRVSALWKISTPEEAKDFLAYIFNFGNAQGSSTNIQDSIIDACNEIKKGKGTDIQKCDILLLTDGGAETKPKEIKPHLDSSGTNLHTILIGADSNKELEQISETFLKVKSDIKGTLKIVEVAKKAQRK